MPSFGLWEMVIVFLIVLIVFGPKSLPKIGQALGKGIRDFKDAARGISTDLEEDERRRPIDHNAVPRTPAPDEKPQIPPTTQF